VNGVVAAPISSRPGRFVVGAALVGGSACAGIAVALGPVAVAAVVGAAIGLLLLWRFEFSLLALNASFFFGGYAVGITGPGLIKLLGVVTVAAWLLDWAVLRRRIVWVPHLWILALLVLWTVPSALLSHHVRESFATAFRYAMFAALFFLVVQYVTDHERLDRFVDTTLVAATAASGVGLYLFAVDQAQGSASGPLAHNDFAFVLAPVLPLAVWRARHPQRPWVRTAGILMAAVIGVTVVATLSRGALVALAVAAVWLAVVRRGDTLRVARRPAAIVFIISIAIAAVAAAFASGVADRALERKSNVAEKNTDSRIYYWELAGRELAASPLFGIGPGNYEERFTEFGDVYDWSKGVQTTHNTYLNVAAELGMGGLVLVAAYLVVSWRFLRLRGRAGSAEDEFQTALAFAFIVVVVAAAFLTEQYQPPLWVIPALAVASPVGRAALAGRGAE
jgi:putative inorganic carbon (HCO3(-)) transporter